MSKKLYRYNIHELRAYGGYVYADDEESAREIVDNAWDAGVINLASEDIVDCGVEIEKEVSEAAPFLILNPEEKEDASDEN